MNDYLSENDTLSILEYFQDDVCVLPLRTQQDVRNLELHLRHLFRTDPQASCHALNTASYITFRNQCMRQLNYIGHSSFEAALLDGYRLQYVDGNVIVRRMSFRVPEAMESSYDPMDI